MDARRTPVALAGAVSGILFFLAALFLQRPDVAVGGAVLFTAVAVASLRVPVHPPEITVSRVPSDADDPAEAEGLGDARVRIDVTGPDAEAVRLELTAVAEDAHRICVAPHSSVVVRVPLAHSGIRDILVVGGDAVGADGTWLSPPAEGRKLRAAIDPAAQAVPFLPVARTLAGLAGVHEALRAGDGGEFLEIRPFVAGDRLRRIDWKATARIARRPGELYVRRTFATSDADIAIVIDDGDDLAGVTGDWFHADPRLDAPRSLDVAREAAWSLASAALDLGDQVSLHLLSRAGGAVPRGSGIRQRERLRSAIVGVEAGRRLPRERAPRVAPGALVAVLSAFLDDDMVRLVEFWRAAGHRVLAVDTLPALRSERLSPEMVTAARIVVAERAERLREVRAAGADVLVWDADDGTRAADLRTIARSRRRR